MQLIIDCEFNGMGGQLLSMALVPIDPNEPHFYEELTVSEILTEWVRDHVILRKNPIPPQQFQRVLETFLNRFESVEIVADWPEDIELFCKWLLTGPGTRIDTPPLTMTIRRDLDAPSKTPHYALDDAIAIRDLFIQRTNEERYHKAVDEVERERRQTQEAGVLTNEGRSGGPDHNPVDPDLDTHVVQGTVVDRE